MGEVIRFRASRESSSLISAEPLVFRRAAWNTPYFVQMLKVLSEQVEEKRADRPKEPFPGSVPPHHLLKGGMASTVQALYVQRRRETRMRDIYHLAGLMDCMINQVNPVLRTDLLRGMYKKVFELKRELNTHWYGPLDQVLLPIDSQLYNEAEYRARLQQASSMKELYAAIREGTEEMFDILSLEYVFYCPGVRV